MAIAVQHIDKTFGTFRALDDVSVDLRSGEVHALLGANGSGKSTLVKVLSGVVQPDSGRISVDGRPIGAMKSPHHANELGIAVVHQDSPLIDTMSVAECVALFRGFPTAGGRILWSRLEREVCDLLARFELSIAPKTITSRLSPAERALVALVIALDQVGQGLRLLILDEVTAALPEQQAALFLDRATAIASSGVPVLMVTHRLAELAGRAKRVTVLRSGRVVYAEALTDVNSELLIAQMTGGEDAPLRNAEPAGLLRTLWKKARPKPEFEPSAGARHDDVPALQFQAVTTELVKDLSFSLRPGEIVGLAGLVDNGVAEIPALLAGIGRMTGGSITVAGKKLPPIAKPWNTIEAGVVVLPADRLRDGGVRNLSTAENMTLPETGRWWHRSRAQQSAMATVVKMLDIRPPSPQTIFGTLSGGNQQKVLVGKWLLLAPAVLVLNDPTQGVDPNAREMIFQAVREAAAEGIAILILSTEPEQLVRLCSRVLVVQRSGVAELSGAELTYTNISKRSYA